MVGPPVAIMASNAKTQRTATHRISLWGMRLRKFPVDGVLSRAGVWLQRASDRDQHCTFGRPISPKLGVNNLRTTTGVVPADTGGPAAHKIAIGRIESSAGRWTRSGLGVIVGWRARSWEIHPAAANRQVSVVQWTGGSVRQWRGVAAPDKIKVSASGTFR